MHILSDFGRLHRVSVQTTLRLLLFCQITILVLLPNHSRQKKSNRKPSLAMFSSIVKCLTVRSFLLLLPDATYATADLSTLHQGIIKKKVCRYPILFTVIHMIIKWVELVQNEYEIYNCTFSNSSPL